MLIQAFIHEYSHILSSMVPTLGAKRNTGEGVSAWAEGIQHAIQYIQVSKSANRSSMLRRYYLTNQLLNKLGDNFIYPYMAVHLCMSRCCLFPVSWPVSQSIAFLKQIATQPFEHQQCKRFREQPALSWLKVGHSYYITERKDCN